MNVCGRCLTAWHDWMNYCPLCGEWTESSISEKGKIIGEKIRLKNMEGSGSSID